MIKKDNLNKNFELCFYNSKTNKKFKTIIKKLNLRKLNFYFYKNIFEI